jgi:hypothetical protein
MLGRHGLRPVRRRGKRRAQHARPGGSRTGDRRDGASGPGNRMALGRQPSPRPTDSPAPWFPGSAAAGRCAHPREPDHAAGTLSGPPRRSRRTPDGQSSSAFPAAQRSTEVSDCDVTVGHRRCGRQQLGVGALATPSRLYEGGRVVNGVGGSVVRGRGRVVGGALSPLQSAGDGRVS